MPQETVWLTVGDRIQLPDGRAAKIVATDAAGAYAVWEVPERSGKEDPSLRDSPLPQGWPEVNS